MRQLRIKVCGVLAYYMNIEECMNIRAKVDGKPWYHGTMIPRLISRIENTHSEPQTMK